MDGSGKTPVKSTEGVKEDLKAIEAASSDQGSSGGCGSCLRTMRGFFPQEYRTELKQLVKLGGPVVRRTKAPQTLLQPVH